MFFIKKQPKNVKVFTQLSEAVKLITTALETGDISHLKAVTSEPLPTDWVLQKLKRCHEVTPLPKLYANTEFPRDSLEFKLGGHQSELGHIHIDFSKRDDGWEIKRIWMCR